ncbi:MULTISPECIES: hypothetical protein [unclassified Bradyrhizobium]
MLSPSMAIRDRANDYRRYPPMTLSGTTDQSHAAIQPDHPAKSLLRKTATAAWIAMIVTELHLEYDACTLDWFPPGSM